MGEKGRTLKIRTAENKCAVRLGDVNNDLAVHSLKTSHPIEWGQVEIVDREENWYRRRIKEALAIQQCHVGMNLDQGIILKMAGNPFLPMLLFPTLPPPPPPPPGNDVTDVITDNGGNGFP